MWIVCKNYLFLEPRRVIMHLLMFHVALFLEESKMNNKKDTKGRNLKPNESQMKDGRYRYRYIDQFGNRKAVYSWRLVLTDKTPTGKKDDIPLREKEKQIEKDLEDGINIYAAKATVLELLSKYLKTKPKLADSTKTNYTNLIKWAVEPSILGSKRIEDVKKSDIKLLYQYLYEEKKYSVGTIQLLHNLLYPAFQMAVEDCAIRLNPCIGCMKSYARGSMYSAKTPLTAKQQNALLNFTQNHIIYSKYYVLIAFMLGTGLRISETIGIRWDDIDLEEGYVDVNHQAIYKTINGETRHRIYPTKTNTNRHVPIQTDLVNLLYKFKAENYTLSKYNDYEVDGMNTFVFLNKNMKLHKQETIVRVLHEIQEAYNREVSDDNSEDLMPKFTPHTLRHTFCTRMAENGCDVKVLQEIMGHKNIAVTMQVYNHVNNERTKKEVGRLPSVLYSAV